MFKLLPLLSFLASSFLIAAPQPQNPGRPVVFEPNRGQAPAEVKWIARGSGNPVLLTNEGATIMVSAFSSDAAEKAALPRLFRPAELFSRSSKLSVAAVRMTLTGGNGLNDITGQKPTGGVGNYLLGRDPKRWHTNIPHYAALSSKQVYDGVDLVFYSNAGDLEYDFIVASGADPKQIRLAFDAVEHLEVEGRSGDLVLTAANGAEIRHLRPKVYQQIGDQRVEVASAYELLDRRHATFTLAAYDRRRPIVIDPAIKFNETLSGSLTDIISSHAVDAAGNVYVVGATNSTDYPVVGAYQTNQPQYDAFVTKLSPTGGIVFSTYLGGSDGDEGKGIAVDSTGVYVTGITASDNFPTLESLYPRRIWDGFITKMTLTGNALVYSTLLGGSKYDYAYGVAVDPERAAWVVGTTDSADFPIAGGPAAGQQRKFGGNWDGFMARIAPDGSSVKFSTFVGGTGLDDIRDVVVDRTGSVYVTGYGAKGFPVTTGMKPCTADYSAIVVRKKGQGTQLPYSTCLGPGEASGIAVDANFNAYIAGDTTGGFPTTAGVFQRTKPGAAGDRSGFVSKVGPSGKMVYSTYFGGNLASFAQHIDVDRTGNVYVGGYTFATKFPGVPQTQPNSQKGFLSKLTQQGKALAYTMLQGSSVSDVSGFQATASPLQVYLSAVRNVEGYDSFVMKLE